MKTIKITFEFSDIVDANQFMQKLGGDSPAATPTTGGVLPTAVGNLEGMSPAAVNPSDILGAANTPQETDEESGKPPTQKAVGDALRAFKTQYGYPKYKELLGYFGVSTVREIPKGEFANVIAMAQTPPAGAAPAQQEQTTNDLDELDELDTPSGATAEQLKQALSEHKAQWGMEATRAVIQTQGYNDPNSIPVDQYGTIIRALVNYSEEAPVNTGGIDLSEF